MKRVFRIGQFMKNMYYRDFWWMAFNTIVLSKSAWPKECDGLTKEEAAELGYFIADDWMVDDYGK